jgi:hypothetical protein
MINGSWKDFLEQIFDGNKMVYFKDINYVYFLAVENSG